MIKINLAKSPNFSLELGTSIGDLELTQKDIQELQKQGLIKLILICIGPLLLYALENINISDLKTQLAYKNNELNKILEKTNKIPELEDKIKTKNKEVVEIKKKLLSVEYLAVDRLIEVKVLDFIQKILPKDVWLKALTFNKGHLRVEGASLTDMDVTTFTELLSKSTFFKEVNLVKTAETVNFKKPVKQFELSCSIE